MHEIIIPSWRFSRYSAPIHWLVHGHMTSNNETVSRQMPWAGNIARTMTSNGKQFTVLREMLTAVARDQSVQLKVAWCCRWNLSTFFQNLLSFCYIINHLMTGPEGNSKFCFPRILNVSLGGEVLIVLSLLGRRRLPCGTLGTQISGWPK